MKHLIISLLVAFFVLSLLGSAIAAPAIKTSDMEIIFIVKASESDFWQIVNDGGRKAAKHFGVKINFQAPTSEADVAKQISILEIAISMKPDAIVLAPTLADALVPGIEKGTASGVPIILIDSAANTDNYTSFLASDNYAIGAMAADMMAEALIKADKEFDLLIIPSQRHGYRGDYSKYFVKKRWNYFIEHLLGAKPIWDISWN